MKIAILGVGNRMRGDDGVGPAAVELLEKELDGNNDVLLLDCGLAPESFSGKVEKFGPEKIIIIDATDMGMEPGSVEVLDHTKIKGSLISTHKLPLLLMIEYLQKRIGAEITFVGCQPEGHAFGSKMSEAGKKATEKAKDMVLKLLA